MGVRGFVILSLTLMALGGLPPRGLREVAGDLGDRPDEVATSEFAELCPAITDLPRVGLASRGTAPSTSSTIAEEAFLRGRRSGSHPAPMVRDLALGECPSVLMETRDGSAAELSACMGEVQFTAAAAEFVRGRLLLPGKVVGIKFNLRWLAAVTSFRPAAVRVIDLLLIRSPLRFSALLVSHPLLAVERRARCSRRF